MTPAELKMLHRSNVAANDEKQRKAAAPFIAEIQDELAAAKEALTNAELLLAERDKKIAELERKLAAAANGKSAKTAKAKKEGAK